MTAAVARFLRDGSGATMVEYAIIASLVSVAMAFAATAVGTQLNGMLATVSDYLN